MNRHPGGEAQTLHLLEYVKFRKGMEALDLGAGEGETVRILKYPGNKCTWSGSFTTEQGCTERRFSEP